MKKVFFHTCNQVSWNTLCLQCLTLAVLGKLEKKKTILEIIFFYLFIKNNSATILLLKVLHLLVSYPPSYTWLKGEPQISRKERFIPSQVLTVWSTWWLSILVFSVNVHQYIYIYIYIYIVVVYIPSLYKHRATIQIFRYFTRILLDKISLVIFLKLWKS